MPNLWETLQFYWLYSYVFASEKYPKNLNFRNFLLLKKLWWLVSTKRELSLAENMYLNMYLRFWFRKKVLKMVNFGVYLSLKKLWWLLSTRRVRSLPENR